MAIIFRVVNGKTVAITVDEGRSFEQQKQQKDFQLRLARKNLSERQKEIVDEFNQTNRITSGRLGEEEITVIKAGRNFQLGVKGFDRHDKPEIVSGRGMSSLGEPFVVKQKRRRTKQEALQEALFNQQLTGQRKPITGKKI